MSFRSFCGLLGVTTIPLGTVGGVIDACSGGKGGKGLSRGIGGCSLFEVSEGIRPNLESAGGCEGIDETRGGGFSRPAG